MKTKICTFTLLSVIIACINFNCGSDSPSSPTTTYKCDQNCEDANVAYGLNHTFWFLWNQNIAGTPVGNKDITVSGPISGSVHIYGTTALSNNNITVVHLTCDFTDCKNSDNNYTLTFAGSVKCDGTFSSTHQAFVFSCAAFTYNGTVGEHTNNPVDATCEISVVQENTNLTGSLCGRTFDN